MTSTLFWDFRQCRFLITDVLGKPIGPIFTAKEQSMKKSTLHETSAERRGQLHRGVILKSGRDYEVCRLFRCDFSYRRGVRNILEELLRPSSTWRINPELSIDTLTNTLQRFQYEFILYLLFRAS